MLLGNYAFDDEGVPAQNVQLIDHGVLKTFLMGRSPLVSIPQLERTRAAPAWATCRWRARET